MTVAQKLYPHITGVLGDEGETPGVLAVHAVLDPSPHYPDEGRIIIGSPKASDKLRGELPNLGGCCMSVPAAQRLIATLQCAIRDIQAVTQGAPGFRETMTRAQAALDDDTKWPKPPWTPDMADAGTPQETWTGRWDSGPHKIPADDAWPAFAQYISAMREREPILARAVTMMRDGIGQGIEVAVFETEADMVPSSPQHAATVVRALIHTDLHGEYRCRAVIRHQQYVAIQYKVAQHWEPVTFLATGMTPDKVLATMILHLITAGYAWDLHATGHASVVELGHIIVGV